MPTESYGYVLFGLPIAQQRHRTTHKYGRTWSYEPAKTKNWKKEIKRQMLIYKAMELKGEEIFFETPIRLQLKFFFNKPKSLPKRTEYHSKKPDITNLVKAVEDALEGILYKNDSQIVKLVASKEYAQMLPRVEIVVSELRQTLGESNAKVTSQHTEVSEKFVPESKGWVSGHKAHKLSKDNSKVLPISRRARGNKN